MTNDDSQVTWGPFLGRPGNLTGPKSYFEIKVSRKVERVLTSNEVHFVSLAENFTVQLSNVLIFPLEWKTKQLNGPGNYRELRETDPRNVTCSKKTENSCGLNAAFIYFTCYR